MVLESKKEKKGFIWETWPAFMSETNQDKNCVHVEGQPDVGVRTQMPRKFRMCCVSIDGLFQRWIQFHLAVPRVGSLWGEGKGARTPPTGLRPSFFWEKFCSAVALLGCPQTHSSALGRAKCLWQGETIKCWREGEHPFPVLNLQDFSGGPMVKNPPANAGHTGSILAPGRFHMPPRKEE